MRLGTSAVQAEVLQERWRTLPNIDAEEAFSGAMAAVIKKTKRNLKRFTYAFPSVTAPGGVYSKIPNEPWTTGFWPG
ncbi:MAG: hypothetical protein LBH54_01355, partial [Clostridiales bacterium]|nr:hypothetical protein [Clostridiales bacterium]